MIVRHSLAGRVLLIGDVHQEDQALAGALAWGAARGASAVLCTGDLADGAGDLERCVALLHDAQATVVRGNHDRWALTGQLRNLEGAAEPTAIDMCRQALERLPRTVVFATPLGPLLLCHGIGDDDMARLPPSDTGYALDSNDSLQTLLRESAVQLVVSGHTHRRMVRRLGGVTFINAGTLCRDHEPCFAELDLDARVVRFVDAGGEESLHSLAALTLG